MMVEMEPLYDRFDAFVTAGMGEAPRLADYRSVSFWQKPSGLTAWNVTGQPVLALPNGFGRNGLPLGMQILGRPFGEATILRVGHAYEQATEWHRRRPALVAGAEAPAVTPPPVLSVTEPGRRGHARSLRDRGPARGAPPRRSDAGPAPGRRAVRARHGRAAPPGPRPAPRAREHLQLPGRPSSPEAARCWPSCGRAMPPARSPASTSRSGASGACRTSPRSSATWPRGRLARVDVGRAGARLHERRRAGRGLARRRRPRGSAAGADLARRARGVGRGRGRRGGDPRDLRELRPREPGQPRAVGAAAASS